MSARHDDHRQPNGAGRHVESAHRGNVIVDIHHSSAADQSGRLAVSQHLPSNVQQCGRRGGLLPRDATLSRRLQSHHLHDPLS